MLKALAALIVGIVIADGFALPLWGVAIGFVVCAAMAITLRHRDMADIYIVVAIMLAGAMALGVRQHFSTTPDTRTRMEIVIDKITSKRERATMADARLVAYNADENTIKSSAEVRVTAAAEVGLAEGERLLVDAKIIPFNADQYGRYMVARGVAGGEAHVVRNVACAEAGTAECCSESCACLHKVSRSSCLDHSYECGLACRVCGESKLVACSSVTSNSVATSGADLSKAFSVTKRIFSALNT